MGIKKPWNGDSDPALVEELENHLHQHSLISASDLETLAEQYVWGDLARKEAMLIEKIMKSDPVFADVVLDASLEREATCKRKMEEFRKTCDFTEEQWSDLVRQYVEGTISDKNILLVGHREIYDDAFSEQIEQEQLFHNAQQILAGPKTEAVSSIQSEGALKAPSKALHKGG